MKKQKKRKIDRQRVLLVLIIISTLFALAVSVTILVNAYCGGWRLLLIRLTLRWNLPDWLRAIIWGWY